MSTGPKGGETSLIDLLETRKIEIPAYQRTFSWEADDIEQLLDCLEEHRKLHPTALQQNPYFLGNLMVHKEDDVWYLVDGQQRLITLTIIAAAVRDLCAENGRYDLAYEIQNDLIFSENRGENYLTPRDTKNPKKSPRRLLKPLQVPDNASFEIKFAEEQTSNDEDDFFKLAEPVVLPWPIKQHDKEEIKNLPGVKFTFGKNYRAGQEVNRLLGKLETDGETISADDNLRFEKEERKKVIQTELGGTWDKRTAIVAYFENKRFKFRGCKTWISDLYIGEADPIPTLKQWKDLLTYMAFTTTSFVREADAIYYFGKLNDAKTSKQLNVGDLMRHNVALCTKEPPITHTLNEDISKSWDQIEGVLKEDTKKNHIPSFLYSWLASQGRRESARNVYTTIKDDLSKPKYKSEGSWNKENYYEWIQEMFGGATKFRQISEPKEGDVYYLSMDSMGRVADQHMPLFLAGLRAFEEYGMNDQMSRLIRIYEYMTIKGVEIPSAVEIGNSISGPEKYSWVDSWCKELCEKTNGFSSGLTEQKSDDILDGWAKTVKSRCDQIWTGAQKEDGTVVTWSESSMDELEVNQGVAKLILTRIELTKDQSKTWNSSIEVEHILPKKWTKEWEDGSKGGKFTEEEGKQYREYLGNRSLLLPEANVNLSNKSFSEKQTMENHGYDAHSSWYITGDLISTKIKTWDPNEIKKRTKKLAGEMIRIYSDSFLSP